MKSEKRQLETPRTYPMCDADQNSKNQNDKTEGKCHGRKLRISISAGPLPDSMGQDISDSINLHGMKLNCKRLKNLEKVRKQE